MAAARVLVSVATLNERENIERLLPAIHAALPDADVLVIDDHSRDGTGEFVDDLAARSPWLKILHRPGKLGLGTALLAALKFARDGGYDYWANLDADFSHPPENLPDLVAGMANFDVMIGSRYVPGGGTVNWEWSRRIMSWAINTYTRLLLGLKARDCSGAFRCYKLAPLARLDAKDIVSTGYSFQEEFLFHCARHGCRIGESPIVFVNRVAGKSNLNKAEMLKALWALFRVAFAKRLLGRK